VSKEVEYRKSKNTEKGVKGSGRSKNNHGFSIKWNGM
jgi:hypothetical protein